MWFDSWSGVLRVLLVGSAAYAFLVLALRVSGKRTLAKLNAFDFVVTVAFGSTLATILLSSRVAWLEGVVALGLLAALQYVVAKAAVLAPPFRTAITSRPTLLLRDGRPLESTLRRQRVTVEELRQAVRATGTGSLAKVAAVVLESDGSLSVVSADQLGDGSALEGVDQPAS